MHRARSFLPTLRLFVFLSLLDLTFFKTRSRLVLSMGMSSTNSLDVFLFLPQVDLCNSKIRGGIALYTRVCFRLFIVWLRNLMKFSCGFFFFEFAYIVDYNDGFPYIFYRHGTKWLQLFWGFRP